MGEPPFTPLLRRDHKIDSDSLLHHLAAIDNVDAPLEIVERGGIHLATIEDVNGIVHLDVSNNRANSRDTFRAE